MPPRVTSFASERDCVAKQEEKWVVVTWGDGSINVSVASLALSLNDAAD